MAIKKSGLYSSIWASCDELRGGMDAQLATLETKRNKTRALEQAMMQELLAGRTRLISHNATCTEVKA